MTFVQSKSNWMTRRCRLSRYSTLHLRLRPSSQWLSTGLACGQKAVSLSPRSSWEDPGRKTVSKLSSRFINGCRMESRPSLGSFSLFWSIYSAFPGNSIGRLIVDKTTGWECLISAESGTCQINACHPTIMCWSTNVLWSLSSPAHSVPTLSAK